ncbi:39S ribosomal protein L50, mitochondrial [Strongylocentrotus purpuratus]|uniref:Large ribosomal subunit protein mL50 n=1 Tax=Strongylocentrotus purpuratus TaxID=7668 RepID=A0A7M7GFL6_STRPU|nr:39S ribosomal protein L50, mitochondrial [Strongylocentrotus purpuratus]|eukprot:XP_003725821.2 PREDICTED: 39S ribosomal protein L50, mitochondrial [Strongylocentrotus purpuratus]
MAFSIRKNVISSINQYHKLLGLRGLKNTHEYWTCLPIQNHQLISTSSIQRDASFKTNEEMSWVRRILQGSGPSADVDETSLEDEVVAVEPRYMEILQEKQTNFISKPETRRRNYSPPHDVEDSLEELTLQLTTETDPVNWKEVSFDDNLFKFQLLSKCSQTFQHSVPSYQLRKMKTVEDVLTFYQTPVKDTSVYDELSTKELPPNLRIQWDYNDSKLEVYEEYLEHIKLKKSRKPSDWPFRPSH